MLNLTVVGLIQTRYALIELRADLRDVDLMPIARVGARLAEAYAPKATGALARSIRPMRSRTRSSLAYVLAGGGSIDYAGPVEAKRRYAGRAGDILRRRIGPMVVNQTARYIQRRYLS